MKLRLLMLIVIVPVIVLLVRTAEATDTDAKEQIKQTVKDICLSPTDKGKYWDVDLSGKGDATIKFKNMKPGISGEARLRKGEWEGVQQVLKEHQAADNDSYRKCVMKLTPIFLDKLFPTAVTPQKTVPGKKVKKNTKNEPDKLEFDVISDNDNSISVLIYNMGESPTAITEGWVSAFIANGPSLSSRLQIEKPILVKGHEQNLLTLASELGTPYVTSKTSKITPYKCNVRVKYNRLGKLEEYISKEFTCDPNENWKQTLEAMNKKNSDQPVGQNNLKLASNSLTVNESSDKNDKMPTAVEEEKYDLRDWPAVVRLGDLKVIKSLVELGAKMDQTNPEGLTALHLAAKSGNLEVLKYLLEKKADPNVTDKNDATPLFLAAQSGAINVVRELVAAGANMDETSKTDSILFGAITTSPVGIASKEGHLTVVKYLVMRGCELNPVLRKEGFMSTIITKPPLELALESGHKDIALFLLEKGAKPKYGNMTIAVRYGDAKLISVLLEKGGNPQEKDYEGKTLIKIAEEYSNTEVANLLKKHK